MNDADLLRYATVVLTLLACLLTPPALYRRSGRSHAASLIVAVLVIQYIGATVAVIDSIGAPIVWYRTPRILAASLLSLAYVWAVRGSRGR